MALHPDTLRIIIPAAAPTDPFYEIYGCPKLLCPVTWDSDVKLFSHVMRTRGYRGHGLDICFGIRPEQWTHGHIKALQNEIATYAKRQGFKNLSMRFVPIETATRGAAETTLIVADFVTKNGRHWDDVPTVVDLCDITFKLPKSMRAGRLPEGYTCGLPVFEALSPQYSYAILNESPFIVSDAGRDVAEATLLREKEVVSNWASAGVYYFRNVDVLARACRESLAQPSDQVNGAWFVCPTLNYAKPCAAIKVQPMDYIGRPNCLVGRTPATAPDA